MIKFKLKGTPIIDRGIYHGITILDGYPSTDAIRTAYILEYTGDGIYSAIELKTEKYKSTTLQYNWIAENIINGNWSIIEHNDSRKRET